MPTENCPICHSEKTKFLFEGYDYYCGYPETAFVYACKECEHHFVAGELTIEQLTDLYTNYYQRSKFNPDDYKPYQEKSGFLAWLDGEEGLAYRHVPKNVRVLDIGCGQCETLGYHKNRGCEVYGVEVDESVKLVADRYGFHFENGLFDPNKYEPNFFDYVTMDQVFEHLVDPLQTLKEINTVLKPNGKLVISCPNPRAMGRYIFGKLWGGWHLPYHRHFYSRKSVGILARQAGFVVEQMRCATESKYLHLNLGFIFVAGKKGEKAGAEVASCGQFDEKLLKRWDIYLFSLFRKMRFLSFTSRMFDLLGRGDCHLIVLQKGNE
ncbi:MAG: methyltransferase domain-containing protein [Thermoguttaceae bacterium]